MENAELPGVKKLGAAPVTEVCLGCICQAVSGCKQGTQCEGDHCGLFHITWPYWADAGKPTINGLSPEDPQAYPSCTNDPYCAALAVQGYMAKYGQDCNGDGQINCYDYMAIHKKGGYGCADHNYQTTMKTSLIVLVAILALASCYEENPYYKPIRACGMQLARTLEAVCLPEKKPQPKPESIVDMCCNQECDISILQQYCYTITGKEYGK
ncbi:unnamed protein product [Chilo suppressalis]|uniref:lysozyme n=1 Tax=Chilo suppressalis TaxID=168631 RepID=A0ABN8AYU1_CHISP|nr:unnamed protein product [Chilo suppressalis]